MKNYHLSLLLFLITGNIIAQPRPDVLFFKDRLQQLKPENIFKTEGYYNWCSSIIKTNDGFYHLFYSRWPKKYGFDAWLTHSEVARAISKSPSGPWEYKETVLTCRGKGYWDAITVHNPKITCFDGKFYLYYCSTNMGTKDYTDEELIETAREGGKHPNWKILRPNQRTGVAVAPTINGPWTRMDQPLIEPSGPITTLTVNPAIDRGKDGKYYLIVKGDKPGIYMGIRWNSLLGVHDFKVNGEGIFRDNHQKYYNRMVEGMVKEICTNYGEWFEIWFDGGADSPENGAPDVLPIVQQYQPNCLFYHNKQLAEARWGGSESGTVSYPCWATFPFWSTGAGESAFKEIIANNFQLLKTGDPSGKYWTPAMSDAPLRGYNGRHEWFWEPGDEKHIYPLNNLIEMYYKSVGLNSTLIFG